MRLLSILSPHPTCFPTFPAYSLTHLAGRRNSLALRTPLPLGISRTCRTRAPLRRCCSHSSILHSERCRDGLCMPMQLTVLA